MFTVHMLDAAHGDCLWIEYGDPARPKRILIDTGPAATWTQQTKCFLIKIQFSLGVANTFQGPDYVKTTVFKRNFAVISQQK